MDNSQLSLRNESNDPRRAFRAKRGDVRIAILDLLRTKGSSTGYKLMQLIREKSNGVWRVSAGSVYPTLEKMRDEELIQERYRDGNTFYSITPKGTQLLSQHSSDLTRIWNFSEQTDLGALEPLEQELIRLSEAIQLASRNGKRVTDKVYMDVVNLRKKIFGYLSE